jgi:2-polyprenyl-3-methyl-5-hydroxy-6-metoxy-1,4-benzoquinol methylase
MKDTSDIAYTQRLESKDVWWKKLLDVQRPYRANLARLELGYVLDIGCGIGRNLDNLKKIGLDAVGVDHNAHSVRKACHRGFTALDGDEFDKQYGQKHQEFDSFLISHVLEHMDKPQAVKLITAYLPLLKPDGRVVIITPQERGFASDPTHVEFMDFQKLFEILKCAGLELTRSYNFPFPRTIGKIFKYNEFIVIGKKAT